MSFDEEVDVLVAGTGAAGCAAAVAALYHGANKVLVAEKSKKLVGGTTKLAGGGWLWCPNNRYLKQQGVRQDPEEILELLKDLAYGKGPVDPDDEKLMRSFAYDWPNVVETILENKFMELRPVDVRDMEEDSARVEAMIRGKMAKDPEFSKKTGINESNIKNLAQLMPSYCAEHPYDLCPSGKVLAPDGSTTSRQLEKSVRSFGDKSEIRMGTQVVDLIFEGKRVVGAVVMDVKTKETKKVRAKNGVIFGTGGYSHNMEMKKKYMGAKFVPFGTCSSNTNTGDLCEIAQRYAIPLDGMHQAWFKQVVLPFSMKRFPGAFFLNADSFIVVDRSGKRYACEKDFYQQRGLQMYQNPERQCVFFVFDKRSRDLFAGPIKGLGGPIPGEGLDDDCMIEGNNEEELTAGIKELLTKVAPDFKLQDDFSVNLKAQVNRFNGYCKDGKDPEFGRGDDTAQYCWHVPRAKDNNLPNKTMYPIDQKNLRCVILGLSTLDTKGGPKINPDGQILGRANIPIEGLYGAGNCVKSSTNISYPASGATLSNGVLFGFKAGTHAMKPNSSM